ncbi:MAG: dihydrolipoamide acetyltransferase family protein [Rhodospirillales bacterium]
MATPVEMPKLGNTVEQCLLGRWVKRAGDTVDAGELIAEIETDKATFELVAPVGGTVLETFFGEGELVPVYTNVCVIGKPGESTEEFRPRKDAAAAVPVEREEVSTKTAAIQPQAARAETATIAAPRDGEVHVSPRARRFAAERGIDPRLAAGSGPGGRILEQDVKALYFSSPRISPLARVQIESGRELRGEGSGPNAAVLSRDLSEPGARMSGIREKIARRMRESLASTAQYTLSSSAEATGLLALRKKIKAAHQAGRLPDININELVVFACVKALREMPQLNAELIDGKIYQHSRVHIGFACDTPRGLLVPVVRDCQDLALPALAEKIKLLAQQALDGTIAPDDLSGATFTVSNLGSLGIESFTPILNSPQVAVLGVNAIQLKPVRRGARVRYVEYIGLSLTCDHQVIDGAPGARFLRVLAGVIENIESAAELEL